VDSVAKTIKPVLAQKFENFFWVHSPNDWNIKSIFTNNILYMIITVPYIDNRTNEQIKIRRQFHINIFEARKEDLCGMAADCIDEIRTKISELSGE